MEYLIIAVMAVLACTKVTIQSGYSKMAVSGFRDSIMYNFIMFVTVAVIFMPFLFFSEFNLDTVIFGCIMGVLSVAFQVSYMLAFSKGKTALVTTVGNFSMIIPILVCYIFFSEPFTAKRIAGTALAVVALCFITAKSKNNRDTESTTSKGWLFFTLISFLCNGLISVNQKIYAQVSAEFNVFCFVAAAYITAAIMSFVVYCVSGRSKKVEIPKSKPGKACLVSGIITGAILGTFQCVSTYAASVIDGTVLYSAYNCITSIMIVFAGRLVFKEKLSAKQYVGVVLGMGAVLCMV